MAIWKVCAYCNLIAPRLYLQPAGTCTLLTPLKTVKFSVVDLTFQLNMQGIGDDSPGEYEIQCYLLLAFHQDNFDEMKEYSNWAVDYELLGNHSLLNL